MPWHPSSHSRRHTLPYRRWHTGDICRTDRPQSPVRFHFTSIDDGMRFAGLLDGPRHDVQSTSRSNGRSTSAQKPEQSTARRSRRSSQSEYRSNSELASEQRQNSRGQIFAIGDDCRRKGTTPAPRREFDSRERSRSRVERREILGLVSRNGTVVCHVQAREYGSGTSAVGDPV